MRNGDDFSAEVVVRKRIFASDDGRFAVLECTSAGERVSLVGPIAHLEANERAQVSGRWATDARYGPQVRVDSALPVAPSEREAVVAYLHRVRHIGDRRAERLFAEHGAATIERIDRDPPVEFRKAGLSAKRAAEAAASWEALRATRQLHMLLAPHGLAYLVARIHKEYGDEAHRAVRADPYGLTSVFGVGFQIADRIARGLGVRPRRPGPHARRRAARAEPGRAEREHVPAARPAPARGGQAARGERLRAASSTS